MQDRLDGGEDVVLIDERHLHVELVELPRERSARASSSRKHGAIWKYRSNPATIRSCLNCCGACGSGVRLARMEATRHEVVARAFRGARP